MAKERGKMELGSEDLEMVRKAGHHIPLDRHKEKEKEKKDLNQGSRDKDNWTRYRVYIHLVKQQELGEEMGPRDIKEGMEKR